MQKQGEQREGFSGMIEALTSKLEGMVIWTHVLYKLNMYLCGGQEYTTYSSFSEIDRTSKVKEQLKCFEEQYHTQYVLPACFGAGTAVFANQWCSAGAF